MAYINVNRENTDQFYRYKMPSLMAKVLFCQVVPSLNLTSSSVVLCLLHWSAGGGEGKWD